jgi:methyl-accepting chemotaxis protein
MHDMASGSRDLTQRVDDARKDELGQLGKAFNTFVTDLNESNAKARQASDRIEADAMTLQNKVEQMLAVTDAAGNGDFTVKVPVTGDDAIGRLAEGFRRMLEKISDLIRQTASGAVQIDAGAQQIAGASQALASGASQQAASLEEISASLEEITSMTNQNADNAQQASSLSAEAQKSADKGKDQTGRLSDAMKQIQESADKVSAIIKTIDDIAFQTNLLALNAAVEAARAGEAGKGFAVVAEEVRNLAQRSAEAAKNTADLITESKSRADTGVSIALGVGKALEEIVAGSSKVNTLLNEIASASREQAQGVAQVNKGVTELDKVTQQNAGNSEELASAAEETASQVACLRDLVGRFKVEDHASSAAASSPSAPPKNTTTRRPRTDRTPTPSSTRLPPAPAAAETIGARKSSVKHAIPFDEDRESFQSF